MFTVMGDGAARTADRKEAARWLADRGFGKAVQTVDVDVSQDGWKNHDFTQYSTEDLDALISILKKYTPARRG
jgi:hypothetical protein